MIKKFDKYINEGIRDLMTPKSEEDIKKKLGKLSPDDKIKIGIRNDVLWLIENGIKENGDYYNNDVFSWACLRNHINIVKLLLNKGLSPNTKHTLTSAVERNHYEIAKLLLELGADPHQHNNYAFTCASQHLLMGRDKKGIYELLKKYATKDISEFDKHIENYYKKYGKNK